MPSFGFTMRVLLPLGFVAALCGGCALVTATIPQVTPGYGCTYSIILDSGLPASHGILVARSRYAEATDRIRCFTIKQGTAVLPEERGVRFTYYTPMSIPIFIGKFVNADNTYLYPLVPGYLPDEEYSLLDEGRYLAVPGRPAPTQFTLKACDVFAEKKALADVAYEMRQCPEEQTESDRRARQEVIEYIQRRLQELGNAQKP